MIPYPRLPEEKIHGYNEARREAPAQAFHGVAARSTAWFPTGTGVETSSLTQELREPSLA